MSNPFLMFIIIFENVLALKNEKIILITGGTGSFGNAFLKRLLKTEVKEATKILKIEPNNLIIYDVIRFLNLVSNLIT